MNIFCKNYNLCFFEGVPRNTDKDIEFADFDIFDDPASPYSTFNFQYSNQAFKRLHDLMEFNTLNNIEVSSSPSNSDSVTLAAVSLWSSFNMNLFCFIGYKRSD